MVNKSSTLLNVKKISLLLGIAIVVFLAWYFSTLTIYIILGLIFALIASPFKNLLSKIHIKNHRISNTVTTMLSLLALMFILGVIVYVVAPPVINQINLMSNIKDFQISNVVDAPLEKIDATLKDYNLIDDNDNVKDILIDSTAKYLGKINISSIFGGVLQGIGSLFLAIFSIFFIAFFMLLDFGKVQKKVVRMVPDEYQAEITNIMSNSKRLLSNYFVGLFLEMLIVGLLEFVTLTLLGIPNALLIAVISGLMIIIPYIGSIIALVSACLIAVSSTLILGGDANIAVVLLKVSLSSVGWRLLDSFILQPFIASRSVKAHPLEIFLIVLLAGMIAGIPGMMLAIPAYTFVRVFTKEFFGNNNFIKTITERLDVKK
ncbi:MAG TPA: AI-2E family transporter [Bacteroidales bacterium]|nr:AI-2E family transporter [Bacteroidales bacterium]HON20103.1 AI-2E family transporter [Bacteroidales bacterium]HOR81637.1 AI-2E family transporter [Bacteroidales bacterium]HPJ90869.1 AI-2E family transporter [Bacteroidales bacterium]